MQRTNNFKIGQGWDRHRLKIGLPLILGGIPIPSETGAIAHSDGDVLIHAIIDALLGALSLGDIGRHFPPSDPKYKNINSETLLKESYSLIQKKTNYKIANIDSTIILESPKLSPYIDSIRQNLSNLLKIPLDSISVKAKTAEKCDAVGAHEAIEAQAIALLYPSTASSK